jgi:hypothetical protein
MRTCRSSFSTALGHLLSLFKRIKQLLRDNGDVARFRRRQPCEQGRESLPGGLETLERNRSVGDDELRFEAFREQVFRVQSDRLFAVPARLLVASLSVFIVSKSSQMAGSLGITCYRLHINKNSSPLRSLLPSCETAPVRLPFQDSVNTYCPSVRHANPEFFR